MPPKFRRRIHLSKQKGLPTVWIKHLKTEEERKNFEILLRNNVQVFTVLRRILQEDAEATDRNETSTEDFDKPGWDYRAARRVGYRAALRRMLQLTNFIEGK